MNDDLIAAARDCFSGIQMGVPEEQIISRGRAVRARRHRSRLAAGALAGLAAGAIAVNALLPASQPGTGTIRLEAWTVQKEANGSVHATIRRLSDPAGLAALRADLVPPSGTVTSPSPRCRAFAQRLARRGVEMIVRLGGVAPVRLHPGHGKGRLAPVFPPGANIVIFEWWRHPGVLPFPETVLSQAARACA